MVTKRGRRDRDVSTAWKLKGLVHGKGESFRPMAPRGEETLILDDP